MNWALRRETTGASGQARAIIALLAILLPLFGLSLIAVLATDRFVGLLRGKSGEPG